MLGLLVDECVWLLVYIHYIQKCLFLRLLVSALFVLMLTTFSCL